MSSQVRISHYNINTVSSTQVMRIKKTSIKELLLVVDPNQFLQTNFIRMVWHGTVRRINYEILGVKGTYWALLVSADFCGTSQLYCTRSQEVLWQSFFTPEGL